MRELNKISTLILDQTLSESEQTSDVELTDRVKAMNVVGFDLRPGQLRRILTEILQSLR